MQSIRDEAVRLGRLGFRVFPCVPYGKAPALKRFYDVATADVSTIEQWWASNPRYNIGIATDDLIVVDVDVKDGREGPDSYALMGGHADTYTVRSPSGGLHYYFTGPSTASTIGLMPGVDTRSFHGYVLGPGSYTDPALTDDPSVKARGYYEVVKARDMAPVPRTIACLLKPAGARRERQSAGLSVSLDEPSSILTAARWLKDTPPAIEGQGGNDATYRVAARLVRDYALSEDVALDLLLRDWNERCAPPWDAEELGRVVAHAAEYATGVVGSAAPAALMPNVTVLEPPPPPPPPSAVELGLAFGNAVDPSTLKPRPWLAHALLMRGETTLLASSGAAGKSTFAIINAAHNAYGMGLANFHLTSRANLRTVIYNAEDGLDEQSRRLLAVCMAYGFDYNFVKQHILFITKDHRRFRFVRRNGRDCELVPDDVLFLRDLVADNGADVFTADPLVALHNADENDPSHMEYLSDTLNSLASSAGCANLVMHHTTKGSANSAADDVSTIRGSGAITTGFRINLKLSGMSQEDAQQLGVRDYKQYIRIDNAKANVLPKADEALAWFRWESLRIPTTDMVGVFKPADLRSQAGAEKLNIACILAAHMRAYHTSQLSPKAAVTAIRAAEALYEKISDHVLRQKIEQALCAPVDTPHGTVQFKRTLSDDGRRDEAFVTFV